MFQAQNRETKNST